MNAHEYIQVQTEIVKMGKWASSIDLHNFLRTIEMSEDEGNQLDPALYKRAQENLAAIKSVALALQDFKKAFDEAFITILKTAKEQAEAKNEEN